MTDYHCDPAWIEQFASRLGKAPGSPEVHGFLRRSHAGYLERTSPDDAAFDQVQLALLESSLLGEVNEPEAPSRNVPGIEVRSGLDLSLIHRLVFASASAIDPGTIRLKRYGAKGAELSGLVHIFDSFGFAVVQDTPTTFLPNGVNPTQIHLDDIELRWTAQNEIPLDFDILVDGERVAEALTAVDSSRAEVDLLNRLVVTAKLTWLEIASLRAYRHYRMQLSTSFSAEELDQALFAFPSVARSLADYFDARFNPVKARLSGEKERARAKVLEELQSVAGFAHDQILRGYLELIDDSMRTNFYLNWTPGGSGDAIVLKFAPTAKEGVILPHAMRETFVYGKDVIGIHLRAGKVARGGIRWSERIEDFRTEIYDLAQAQIKKNAIIVPTGAKGGFVVRNAAKPLPEQIEAAYKTFISSLLEVTDNVIHGSVITPQGILPLDDDDHYLVVAADKGTASFSDLANAISLQRGFWLGDAFASGGSHGYDHKALAITARGAWASVERHFRGLGIDVDSEPFRVVGVGDMSGDIFGNGMLRSKQIRLVAAFDHRDIFLDPNPDPATSYHERQRLARLTRSSWADYDPKALSEGGGVWSRSMKEIPLSNEVRAQFGLAGDSLTPPKLISAILSASVDLIWFGGIGTYIKDKEESDDEIGDGANDSVRITADKVRARVIAEGANLAVSQRARITYARRGGRINTDFIDNAGGVAMSDYEVNLKILLDLAIEDKLMDIAERDAVLTGASDEAVDRVLRQVEASIVALDRAFQTSETDLDAIEALIEAWETSAGFDREADFLPDAEEFAKRRSVRAGLTRPELAVLQSYAKSDLAESMEGEITIFDPTLSELAHKYFPVSVTSRFKSIVERHPLYRALTATILAGEVVDRMGIVWAHETAEELNRSLGEVAEAFWIACKVTDALEVWNQIDQLDNDTSVDASTYHKTLAGAIDALARTYLARSQKSTPGEVISRDRNVLSALFESGTTTTHPRSTVGGSLESSSGAVPPSPIMKQLTKVQEAPRLLEVYEVSNRSNTDMDDVVNLFEDIDQISSIAEINRILASVSPGNRWTSWFINGIRSDLLNWRLKVCLSLISSVDTGGLKTAVMAWENKNQQIFAKLGTILDAARKNEDDKMTLVPLAIRELQSLV